MSSIRLRPYLVTSSVANPALIRLLRSRLGARLGRRLAVVEYVGRRTGQRHQLVTQYSLHGRTVRIGVGDAERKSWWRNFEHPARVRLRLAGEDHDVVAHVVKGDEGVVVEASLRD